MSNFVTRKLSETGRAALSSAGNWAEAQFVTPLMDLLAQPLRAIGEVLNQTLNVFDLPNQAAAQGTGNPFPAIAQAASSPRR